MKLRIKRVDKSLPLPNYEKDAACFDFVCRDGVMIKPGEIKLVPANNVIEVPKGYTLLIFNRSSTPMVKGLMLANGVGVSDSFFRGENDEILLAFLNITDREVRVEKGELLAQEMLVKFEHVEWSEVSKMGEKGRGGYNLENTKRILE